MNRLIIFNSVGSASQIFAANQLLYDYPDAELKDLNAITTGDITTWIGTLTDDNYNQIFLACDTQSAGATAKLSYDQVASLDAKMATGYKGTVVNSGSCQANVDATKIYLDATASAVNDYYLGMYIKTAGVTAVYRYVKGYVGATKIATVNTTTVACTTGDTYTVYTNTYIYAYGDTTASNLTACYRFWALVHPTVTPPLVVSFLGGRHFFMSSGVAAVVAAGTITLAATVTTGDIASNTQHTTNDFYKDMFVYINYAQYGCGQIRKITGYDGATQVATLESAWTIDSYMISGGKTYPFDSVNVKYAILEVKDDTDYRLLADLSSGYEVQRLMWSPTSEDAKTTIKKLIDDRDTLQNSPPTASQDTVWIYSDFLRDGKSHVLAKAIGL